MELQGMVVAQREERFRGRRGEVQQQVLAILDHGLPVGMLNTVDYVLLDEDKAPNGGWSGKNVTVYVTDCRTDFGGRLRVRGTLLHREGKKV